MEPTTLLSEAFRALYWRFPNQVPEPPDVTEADLTQRGGTEALLERFVVATQSSTFRELVDRHREPTNPGAPSAGALPLANAILRAIDAMKP